MHIIDRVRGDSRRQGASAKLNRVIGGESMGRRPGDQSGLGHIDGSVNRDGNCGSARRSRNGKRVGTTTKDCFYEVDGV